MCEEQSYILFDHDGVLVDTERWYYLAGKRALASLGIDLQLDAYLMNMANGVSTWEAARVSGISESEIDRGRELRNRYYQEYLMTEDIEIEGGREGGTLLSLSKDRAKHLDKTAPPR